MNRKDIITLDDNKEYLILDIAEFNNSKYLYTVELESEDMPTTNYKYLEVISEEDGDYVEEVEDKETLEAIASLFTISYLSDSIDTNEEQAA